MTFLKQKGIKLRGRIKNVIQGFYAVLECDIKWLLLGRENGLFNQSGLGKGSLAILDDLFRNACI